MKNQALYDQAKSYLNLGFSIIPLRNNKTPAIKWKQYEVKYPTSRQLKRWFNRTDVTGIGIVTGHISDLVVIDVDPRNGGSNACLLGYSTISSKTPSGGWHYYFRPQNERDYRTRHYKQGFDIIGEGAFIVAPPSLSEKGIVYEWIEPLNLTLLKPFPHEFIEQFKEETPKPKHRLPLIAPSISMEIGGRISETALKQIKRLPIDEVIRNEGINVPKTEKEYVHILCPFHDDHHPSFSVYIKDNYGRCFACGETYNTIDFIEELYKICFRDACIYLMEKYGIRNE